jgi:hypothetical protein
LHPIHPQYGLNPKYCIQVIVAILSKVMPEPMVLNQSSRAYVPELIVLEHVLNIGDRRWNLRRAEDAPRSASGTVDGADPGPYKSVNWRQDILPPKFFATRRFPTQSFERVGLRESGFITTTSDHAAIGW